MTICLTNDQISDKRKMTVLSEETFLKVDSYLRISSKAEVWTHVLRARLVSELSGFVYIKSHVILHVSKA